jgi:hypothetical protein
LILQSLKDSVKSNSRLSFLRYICRADVGWTWTSPHSVLPLPTHLSVLSYHQEIPLGAGSSLPISLWAVHGLLLQIEIISLWKTVVYWIS